MKKSIYICFAILLTIILYNNHTLRGENKISTNNEFSDFYKGLTNDSIGFWEKQIEIDQNCDSIYYFQYADSINGFSIKGNLRNIRSELGCNYIGDAILIFSKKDFISYLFHPLFEISDSVFNKLHYGRLNIINYDLGELEYFNENQLGQYWEVPFAMYDIDFDGKNEILLKYPGLGQRGRNIYIPHWIDEQTERFVDSPQLIEKLDSLYLNNPEYAYYYTLDDQTEFDRVKNDIILFESAGAYGSSRHFYKVKNRLPSLYKKKTYNEHNIEIITYIDNDTIVEYIDYDE